MHTVAVENTRSEHAVRRRPAVPFPAAKLVPPASPARLVGRPRLHDLIDHGTTGLVTLVSAHAGTGKTVLLSSWAASAAPRRVAWLALDRDDNWSPRFWLGVERALANAGALRGTGRRRRAGCADRGPARRSRRAGRARARRLSRDREPDRAARAADAARPVAEAPPRDLDPGRPAPAPAATAPDGRPDGDPRRRSRLHARGVRRGGGAVRDRPRGGRRAGAARPDRGVGGWNPPRRAVARVGARPCRLPAPVRRRRSRRGRLPAERDPRPPAGSAARVPAPHLGARHDHRRAGRCSDRPA